MADRVPVGFAYGPKAQLPSTHRTGMFYAVTDEGRLYVDLPDGVRLPMGMQPFGTVSITNGYPTIDAKTAQMELGFLDVSILTAQNFMADYMDVTHTTINPTSVTNKSYVDTQINKMLSTSLKRKIVTELPIAQVDVDCNTIYMIESESPDDMNVYEEYLHTTVTAIADLPVASSVSINLANISGVNLSTDGTAVIFTSLAITANNSTLRVVESPDLTTSTGGNFKFEVVGYSGEVMGVPKGNYIEMFLDSGTRLYELIKSLYETYPNSPEHYFSTTSWQITKYDETMTRIDFDATGIYDKWVPELIGTSRVDLSNKMDKWATIDTGTLNGVRYTNIYTDNRDFSIGNSSGSVLGLNNAKAELVAADADNTIYEALKLDTENKTASFSITTPIYENSPELATETSTFSYPVHLKGIELPEDDYDAANKKYVDGQVDSLNTKITALQSTALVREVVDKLPEITAVRINDEDTYGIVDSVTGEEVQPFNTIYMVPDGDTNLESVYNEYLFTLPWVINDISTATSVAMTSSGGWGAAANSTKIEIVSITYEHGTSGEIRYFNYTFQYVGYNGEQYEGTLQFVDVTGTPPLTISSNLGNSWYKHYLDVSNVSDTNDFTVTLTEYYHTYNWELIGTSKCNLSGYATTAQYNELKATVDALVAQTSLQTLA